MYYLKLTPIEAYHLIVWGTLTIGIAVIAFLILFVIAYNRKHKKLPDEREQIIKVLRNTKSHLLLSYDNLSFHKILSGVAHIHGLLDNWNDQLWTLHFLIEELENSKYWQNHNKEQIVLKDYQSLWYWAEGEAMMNEISRNTTYSEYLHRIMEEEAKQKDEEEEYFNMMSM